MMEIYNSKRLYYNSENKQQNKKITDTLLVCSLWASCLANFKIMRQCVFGLELAKENKPPMELKQIGGYNSIFP